MKSPYIKAAEANRNFTTSLLVRSKEIREKKTGEPYLSLSLCDRTGEIEAKMWDNVAEVMDTFERDDFVKVKGLIQIYHNRPQLTIHKMRRLEDSEVDFADYFPASARDVEVMWRELIEQTSAMSDVHLRALVKTVLEDPEIAQRYRKAPAAKQIHHAWLGGLLEHVLSLCQLCRYTSQHYRVDLDLLLTGAVLHDIGKVYELSYDRSFGYTAEGQLLGHMVIALRIVSDKLRDLPDFPPRLRTLPQFAEALLFHYLDDMDSKMECMRALVDQDRQVEGYFTGFSTSLERMVLKKAKYLSSAESNGHAATPAPARPPQKAAESPATPKAIPKEAVHPLFAAPPAEDV
jgi:3'-5' exoribonuclease